MNYNCERCGDRLGWREHQGPTLCERCRLRAEVEKLRAENGRIMNTFQKAQAELRNVRTAWKAERTDLESCRQILTETRNREGELSDEVERLRAELAETRAIQEMDEKYGEVMSDENDDLKREVERLRAERDDARIQRDTAMTTLELSQAEVERLRAELDYVKLRHGCADHQDIHDMHRAALAKEDNDVQSG